MKITQVRIATKKIFWDKYGYTISKLFINDQHFCDCLEPLDRGFDETTPIDVIRRKKEIGPSAIPTGCYTIDMATISPRFGNQQFYKDVCCGRLPRFRNVRGYDGVLVHVGNTFENTQACVLVGHNTQVGKVLQSRDTFKALYAILKRAAVNKETISWTITRTYAV